MVMAFSVEFYERLLSFGPITTSSAIHSICCFVVFEVYKLSLLLEASLNVYNMRLFYVCLCSSCTRNGIECSVLLVVRGSESKPEHSHYFVLEWNGWNEK